MLCAFCCFLGCIPFAVVVGDDFNVGAAFVSVSEVAAVVGAVSGWRFTTIVFLQKKSDLSA